MKKFILMTLLLFGCFGINAQVSKAGNVVELSQTEFANVVSDFNKGIQDWKYKGKRPAVIDFYAVWCGPCRKIAPIMDELAKEYTGKIDFYKVDVDKAPQLSKAYGITSIPMILFVPINGNPQVMLGQYPKDDFVKAIDNVIFKKTTK